MASSVEICNMALSRIRAGNINSFDDATVQADACSLWYGPTRDSLLEKYSWGFSVTTEALALTSNDIFNWVYAYAYPSHCLHIETLIRNYEQYSATAGQPRPRSIEALVPGDFTAPVEYTKQITSDGDRLILSNEKELRIRYRRSVEDPNKYSSLFIDALSALLASRVAVHIVGADLGRALKKDAQEDFKQLITDAGISDANQQSKAVAESEFVTVRGGVAAW